MNFKEDFIYKPNCFKINRMNAHSDHKFYASINELNEGSSSYNISKWIMEICIC